jgi:hypothetical protein
MNIISGYLSVGCGDFAGSREGQLQGQFSIAEYRNSTIT